MMTLRLFILLPVLTNAFQTPAQTMPSISSTSALKSTAAEAERTDKSHLYVPSKRDAHYQGDVARYLLDLDGEGATFDFCGGAYVMMLLVYLRRFDECYSYCYCCYVTCNARVSILHFGLFAACHGPWDMGQAPLIAVLNRSTSGSV